ncbi:MAG TPA: hypothetical protein VM580_03170 [Labilithrix sp.]|nr:hypothetical protein [Labilithrix sp.]
MRRAAFVVAILAASLSWLRARPAAAQKPVSQATEYSPYEKEAIREALAEGKLEIDPVPEGKTIGRINIVRLEVLEPRDPGPELLKRVPVLSPLGKYVPKSALNALHVLSREYIIRRELLLKEGERYVQVLMDETARNMRTRMGLQISLVVIVPVKSAEPGKVDLLVITKDIWSLRLSLDVAATPGGIENLIIVPQETNFLGRHHTVQTRFQMQPETLSFGVGYKIPRFGYSWIGAAASASIFVNRRRSEPEGSSGALSVGQSLYSTRTEWAWDADFGYTVGVARRYSNAAVFLFNSRATPERDNIPFEYKSRTVSASAGVTRSFGWGIKNNVSLTFNATIGDYETFNLSRFNPVAAADFRRRALPTSESRVYPALSWRTFANNYLRTLDVNTLALQEDFRLGHDVSVSVYPVFRALGSSRDLIGVSGKAAYAVALGDGFAGGSVSTVAETQDGTVTDGSVGAAVGAVTPRIFGVGRIVTNISFTNRYRNYLNARSYIGGEDRLRGYPTSFFFGKDTVFLNVEYRSRSLDILKAQIAGVLFYDVGDAAQGVDMLRAKQSVGLGLRVLFPQVNRNVLRIDVAFPMKRGPFPETGSSAPVDPVGFYFAFDQAFNP